MSGDNVTGVSLQIRKGYWQAWNPVEATTTTDSSGNYSFGSMDAGGYTVYTTKSGYINGKFYVSSFRKISNQDSAISENLPGNKSMRIVLSWLTTSPQTGRDLDSHIYVPDNSTGMLHLHFAVGGKQISYSTTDNVTCLLYTSPSPRDS